MNTNPRWCVGIDVGGTFTDLVAVNRSSGEVKDTKVLTTRPRQEEGVLQSLEKIGIPLAEIDEIVHGHTTGINAVLSRQGAKTALLATAGHQDLLDIGRMDRDFAKLYDPTWLRPHQERPVVRRRDRYGVRERMGAEGESLLPLDEKQVREIAQELKTNGIESVAICFMNSYVSRQHELRAAEIIRQEIPGVYVQTSELYPVTKEHERTTTVVFDAYVGPTVTGYLHRLENKLGEVGFKGSLWIMTMNGGVGSVKETSKAPVFQLVSGPVGGVSGVVQLARARAQSDNFVSMDVGGTSTDVAAVQNANTPLTDLWTVEHGLVMTMPAVDVKSVGSGAGSIVHVDDIGSLHVGPESSGSQPGPACYGRGGMRPTLTDACAHLGILQPDLFAGGDIRLDLKLAEKALASVGDQLGMSATALADAAYRLACTDMAAAIRSISTHRGYDLRTFSLLAFGSAGPMMAVPVGRELGMNSVVIPVHPGEFSAYGLIASDLRVTRATSPLTQLNALPPAQLESEFVKLESALKDDLGRQGVDAKEITLQRHVFVMYLGQTWDNRMELEPGLVDEAHKQRIIRRVHDFYLGRYGFSAEELPIMITTIEVTAAAKRFVPVAHEQKKSSGKLEVLKRTNLRLGGQDLRDVPVYRRDQLGDAVVAGPAVVVETYATTVLDRGSSARRDAGGNLNITLEKVEASS